MESEPSETGRLCLGRRKRKREKGSVSSDLPSSPDPEDNGRCSKNPRPACNNLRFSCRLLDLYLYGYKTKVLQPVKESEHTKSNGVKFPPGMTQCESSIPGSRFGVCCSRFISAGTWIGPYEGEVIRPEELTANRDNGHMWEIYKDGKLSHYVDGNDSKFSNWMSSIQCARHKDEQNMTVFQYNALFHNLESRGRLVDGVDQLKNVEPNEYFGMESFNEVNQWRCGQCEKSFSQRVNLQMHVCSKPPEQPFQCGQCTSSFSRADELRGHVVQHVSDKPFKCGFCARTFSGSTTLSNHIRTHTGEKPFKCRKCGKSFSQSTQLSRHEKSGESCA